MRLFIAATFPSDVIADVDERVSRVRPRLGTASWVKPESQHLTFAFLGEQKEAMIGKVVPLIESALAAVPSFEGTLEGCGFFPNARHARVGWVGVAPEEKFSDVATAIRGAVTTAGVQLDRADFKPHLTLCRIRDTWPPACTEWFHKALRDYKSRPFGVDRVTLFSSQLNPKGAIHTAVREFPLAGATVAH